MKKIFGYVLGLVAALFAAGAIATTANADGSDADAASGSSNAGSALIGPAMGSSEAGGAAEISSAESSSQKPAKKLAKKPAKKVAKRLAKREKRVAADKKLRGRLHYRKDAREILFQKGKKGEEVYLYNRKGKEVKKFRVAKNGRFDIKLSKKQAKKLDEGGKYFHFAVYQKGYKPYEIRYYIYK
ncbi:hypothetical protein [Levilactobacillus fuyuanensis]|uniref:Uncharacterized protein n=1 Tax=Levilactobacillus fuyuanensis TaxID=2486022 RepID=A0ABW4H6B9_9LACO|nr:hypothetical protein [Levilactobacillus fuyuanensis]